MKEAGIQGHEVLIEFHQVGNAVKVSAIDPETLVEVSIVGAPGHGRSALEAAAIRKLEYVLEKRQGPARRR